MGATRITLSLGGCSLRFEQPSHSSAVNAPSPHGRGSDRPQGRVSAAAAAAAAAATAASPPAHLQHHLHLGVCDGSSPPAEYKPWAQCQVSVPYSGPSTAQPSPVGHG